MTIEEMDLPLYPATAQLGEKGVRMIANAVEDGLNWIFRPNTKTDVGIDGEIEYVTAENKSTGKLIAVQIKCGQSYLSEKTDTGYIFRCRQQTVNYWLSLSLPVILCLCDDITNKIYWCHITIETIQRINSSYKIEVPYENELTQANAYKLRWIFNSGIPIQSIADSAIFKYLHERYMHNVKICPLIDEPIDFHNLSYIAEIKQELYLIGTVIDRYGYFDEEEIKEQIRLYYENRKSCGWEISDTTSKFLLFFVSEKNKNLQLTDSIKHLMQTYGEEIEYERLHLSREFISATYIAEDGSMGMAYADDGSGEYYSLGWNAFTKDNDK